MNAKAVFKPHLSKALCVAAIAVMAGNALAETWVQTGVDRFTGSAASAKGQGLVWTGSSWIFSSSNGLERTDAAFNRVQNVNPAIPAELFNPSAAAPKGLNHIGDLDVAGNTLYIALDSSTADQPGGGKYNTPVIALYDATTLTYTGQSYALTAPGGVQDIASWVAVDAAAGLGYGMAYDNATQLSVYNLADWSFKEYVPLSHNLDQVQGGKLFGDWMYMSSDGAEKEIYRTNVKTGAVEDLFSINLGAPQEIEGLSFAQDASGNVTLNVLNREAVDGVSGVALYHFSIAAVPEPATFVLMLTGFALVGGAARRSRSRARQA
ncbi:PEPxxWA-CTERM sorting domain-containing protein [Paucibacter sp. R3-3]|uniref:PEPxxWA-CTERM sorting domain-containing protein n=1 Tax=Roseateles agri TaxID=3098619 RepID=A0ABU5DH22_9BURK|nr:PEPxxWA-CTERM sorting domain-containing protein [Paucibacter sp. R3-3]MDY0745577.1 PEPxxWA-CTERM sorting domain-containing protein [Paucibacter sp. R3-3]